MKKKKNNLITQPINSGYADEVLVIQLMILITWQ